MSLAITDFDGSVNEAIAQFKQELTPVHAAAYKKETIYSVDVQDITRELKWECRKGNTDLRRYAAWVYHLKSHLTVEELEHTPAYEFACRWESFFASFFHVAPEQLYTLCRYIDYRFLTPTTK